jgi:hypothetical protein
LRGGVVVVSRRTTCLLRLSPPISFSLSTSLLLLLLLAVVDVLEKKKQQQAAVVIKLSEVVALGVGSFQSQLLFFVFSLAICLALAVHHRLVAICGSSVFLCL